MRDKTFHGNGELQTGVSAEGIQSKLASDRPSNQGDDHVALDFLRAENVPPWG